MIPLLGQTPGGITIQRYGPYTRSGGRAALPTPVAVPIAQARISIQAASRDSIQRLPEGVSVTGAVGLYSYDELKVEDEVAQTAADRFVFDGQTFQVQLSERMPAMPSVGQPEHWEATATVVAALPMPMTP